MTFKRGQLALAGFLTATTIGISACGSSGGASPGNSASAARATAQVNGVVAQAMAPVTAFPDGSRPITAPSGKRIVAITCGSQGYGCVQGALGATKAAQSLGWSVTTVDGKSDPSVWNSALQQAIVTHANGVILLAISPQLVQGALASAKAAHIPVIEVFQPQFPGPAASGYVTTDHVSGGKELADWIIKDSGGQAQVLVLDEPEFPELGQRNAAVRAELKAACPGCQVVDSVSFNIGTMPQQLPQAVISALQQHPDINYVVAPFDSSAVFASQGITQAGKAGTVKLVSGEGDPPAMSRLQSGAQAADLATVPQWGGWAAVDELVRIFGGQNGAATELLPQRLFTRANALSAPAWPGDINYQAKFESLWK
jgi:ribose transport system substrate-binding protein